MAFQQLYYTSCEHGLGGYGGYQFNAVTPGVSPEVLREVEQRTVYEPPRWRTGQDADGPDAYPIAFSYTISSAGGPGIAANVVFTGTDYSGRPGNYFVHALATGTPEQDFKALLPAELWGSPLWHSTPVAGTELPELSGPLPPGVIDRPGAQAFLDARKADTILPELLSAVGRAMAGERPVLMVTRDVTENAWWIAAVSYLLGDRLARQLTFTTYSHRPSYSRYHLIGTLPDALLPETSASFQIFDLANGQLPRDAVHPLAATLASTGVMGAAGLWQQAGAFASGREASLDDWLAPVTVAGGVLGRPLSAGQADTAARWLVSAASFLAPGLADVALRAVLGQSEATLTDERLRDLLNLARQLPAPPRVEQLERLVAVRAIARITRSEQAVPVQLTSPAIGMARNLALQLLDSATPRQAMAVLHWTAASGAELPDDSIRHYGRTRLGPHLPEAELAAVARCHPAIRRGLLERLADEPPEVAKGLLGGAVGTQLERQDLADHPELTELWLLESVARGRTQPMRAFDEIVDIHDAAGVSPRVDAALLHLLWPRECPPDDLTELLGVLTDPPTPEVADWFTAQLGGAAARATASDSWLRLTAALSGHPILSLLPAEAGSQLQNVMRVLPLLRRAGADGPHGSMDAFAELFRQYPTAEPGTRELLKREIPVLLAVARPLGAALPGCPHGLTEPFALAVRGWLAPGRADTALAREVFTACGDPELLAAPGLTQQLMAAFEQVRHWSRRDLGVLAQSMDDDVALAQSFRRWRKASRTDGPGRLLGRGRPSAQDT